VKALALRMSKANVPEDEGIGATLFAANRALILARKSILLAPLQILIAVWRRGSSSNCLRDVANCCWPGSRRAARVQPAHGPGRRPRSALRASCSPRIFCWPACRRHGPLLSLWMGQALGSLLPPPACRLHPTCIGSPHPRFHPDPLCRFGIDLVHRARHTNGPHRDHDGLKEGGRSETGGTRSHRMRAMLVISEVSLALVALIGAGLFAKSFQTVRKIQSWLRNRIVFCLSRFYLSTTGYNLAQREAVLPAACAERSSPPPA